MAQFEKARWEANSPISNNLRTIEMIDEIILQVKKYENK
jgi:hypothetical protein